MLAPLVKGMREQLEGMSAACGDLPFNPSPLLHLHRFTYPICYLTSCRPTFGETNKYHEQLLPLYAPTPRTLPPGFYRREGETMVNVTMAGPGIGYFNLAVLSFGRGRGYPLSSVGLTHCVMLLMRGRRCKGRKIKEQGSNALEN
jgi:hypothetical protein